MTGPSDADDARDVRLAAIDVIRQLSGRIETLSARQETESRARRDADDLTRSVLQRAVVQRMAELHDEVTVAGNAASSQLADLAGELREHRLDAMAVVERLERTGGELRQVAEAQRHMVDHQGSQEARLQDLAARLAAQPEPGDWGLVDRLAQVMQAQGQHLAALAASMQEARSEILEVTRSHDELAGSHATFDQRLAELADMQADLGQRSAGTDGDQAARDQRLAELTGNQVALNQHAVEVAGNQAALNQHVADLAANQGAFSHELADLAARQVTLRQDVADLAAGQGALNQHAVEMAANLAALDQRLAEVTGNQVTFNQHAADMAASQAALSHDVAELAESGAAVDRRFAELAANQARLNQNIAELVATQAPLHRRLAELSEEVGGRPAPPAVSTPVTPASPLAVLEAELRDIENRLAQRTGRRNGNT